MKNKTCYRYASWMGRFIMKTFKPALGQCEDAA